MNRSFDVGDLVSDRFGNLHLVVNFVDLYRGYITILGVFLNDRSRSFEPGVMMHDMSVAVFDFVVVSRRSELDG